MEKLYEGKSKIVYAGEAPGTCIIRYKDTATAGNGAKKEDLPGKGKLNAEISNYIYQYLMDNGVKTHLLKVIDDTTVLVKQAEIVMVEVIVRNVAAGSFSKKYGVPEGTALKNTVVEFSLKSDELGDPMINDCQITALGVATQAELASLPRPVSNSLTSSWSLAVWTANWCFATRSPRTPAVCGTPPPTRSWIKTASAGTWAMCWTATVPCWPVSRVDFWI